MENLQKLNNDGIAIALSLLSKENQNEELKDLYISYSNHSDKNIRYEAIKALNKFDGGKSH